MLTKLTIFIFLVIESGSDSQFQMGERKASSTFVNLGNWYIYFQQTQYDDNYQVVSAPPFPSLTGMGLNR